MPETMFAALVLGVLEGLTEFIPVSSTGHILLAGHFMRFESAGKTFEVVIQLGAVLAVMVVYFTKLAAVFVACPHDPQARRTILSVLIAFLPAVIVGVLAHDIIKTILFESPRLIAIMLILGGIVLLVVDRIAFEPRFDDAMHLPLTVALKIGLLQCLAMIPGVSRSGATIVGALTLGASKRAAAEFSFFLSMPTMAGAFGYDLWQNRAALDSGSMAEIAIGFAAAFVVAVVVVRGLLSHVSRYGYAMFGWWRIIVGAVVLVALSI